jgi:hypothetical protein
MIHELSKKRGIEITKLPLWDRKGFHKAGLKKKCDELTLRQFDKGFRQKPVSDTERMFPSFNDCIKYGIDSNQVIPQKDRVFVVSGVDLSSVKRRGNAIFTLGVRNDYKRVPLDIRIGAWTSPEVAYQLAEVNFAYKPNIIIVENNGYQQSIIQWIQASPKKYDFWTKVVSYNTGKQKWSDEMGLPSLESEFSVGSWIIPIKERHLPDCVCAWCLWINEMRSYTRLYGESDILMAAWFCREAIRIYTTVNPVKETISIPDDIDEMEDVFDIVSFGDDEYGL